MLITSVSGSFPVTLLSTKQPNPSVKVAHLIVRIPEINRNCWRRVEDQMRGRKRRRRSSSACWVRRKGRVVADRPVWWHSCLCWHSQSLWRETGDEPVVTEQCWTCTTTTTEPFVEMYTWVFLGDRWSAAPWQPFRNRPSHHRFSKRREALF